MGWSCVTPPEYPIEPEIGYESIFFKKGEFTDTLLLTINFKDGDGDLGLHPDFDVNEPYNALWYFVKTDGNFLTYKDRNAPPYDTLPPYSFPYYCTNYSIEEADTFYVQKNPNHFNIFVDFYIRKNGEYQLYDWVTANPPQCGESYNGRFPVLKQTKQASPLEGELKYSITGAGFEVIFKRDTVKLEVRIQDRALHKSNLISTPDFVLKDIQIN